MRSLPRTFSLYAGLTGLVGGTLLVAACSDPELKTELDSEGPPEVNTVTVSQEGDALFVNGGDFFEAPTFCREGGKLHREICPTADDGTVNVPMRDDVTPMGWQVRVVFSELLDPDVEDLVETSGGIIGTTANTNPLLLTCGGTAIVGTDGHYDPSGNDVSAPPGPSVVVRADASYPASAGSTCSVSVAAIVTDKDGEAVSNAGPFDFALAPMHFSASDPGQTFDENDELIESEGFAVADADGNTTPVSFTFNAPVDLTSIDTDDIEIIDVTNGNTPVPATITYGGDAMSMITNQVVVTPDTQWAFSTSYSLTLKAEAPSSTPLVPAPTPHQRQTSLFSSPQKIHRPPQTLPPRTRLKPEDAEHDYKNRKYLGRRGPRSAPRGWSCGSAELDHRRNQRRRWRRC